MPRLIDREIDLVFGYSAAAGSALINSLPDKGASWAARHFLKLNGPNDSLLRWRVATEVNGSRTTGLKCKDEPGNLEKVEY